MKSARILAEIGQKKKPHDGTVQLLQVINSYTLGKVVFNN